MKLLNLICRCKKNLEPCKLCNLWCKNAFFSCDFDNCLVNMVTGVKRCSYLAKRPKTMKSPLDGQFLHLYDDASIDLVDLETLQLD